jgi:hypothetical protein
MSTFSRHVTSVEINQATGNQSVTGFGFTPKLSIFITEPSVSDIIADVANFHSSIGAATDSSNQWNVSVNSRNGQVSSSSAFSHDNTITGFIADPPGSMTPDYKFSLVSHDSDGLTFNVDDAPPSNYKTGIFSIGGDAITNVSVGRFNSKGSTGSQAISGLGFKPDCLLFFSVIDANDPRTSNVDAKLSISLITADNQIAYDMVCRNGQNPSISKRAMNYGLAFLGTITGSANALVATLTSLDADGWTLNWSTHSVALNERIYYIALKGASDMNFNVGTITLPNSTGSFFSENTGFANRAGIFLGACLSALTSTLNSHMELSFGVCADTNRYVIGGQNKDNVSPSVSSHFSHSKRIFRNVDQAGAVQEDIDVSSWQNSNFTLNSITALGASSSVLAYMVMGTDVDADSQGEAETDPTGGSGTTDSPDSSFLLSLL